MSEPRRCSSCLTALRSRKLRLHVPFAFGGLLVLLTGCRDDPMRPNTPPAQLSAASDPAQLTKAAPEQTREFPWIRRVDLDIRAVGPFRPGKPIRIISKAHANRDAAKVHYQLLLLDADSVSPRIQSMPALPLHELRSSISAQAQRQLDATLTFARPGYYRVQAKTISEPAEIDRREIGLDTLVLNNSSETLYILVNEAGGRITQGFDPSVPTADSTRIPLYGSYGPFVPTRAGTRRRALAAVRSNDPFVTTQSGSGYIQGVVRYQNDDTGTKVGLPSARVQIRCWDPYFPERGSEIRYISTAADGTWSTYCTPINTAYEINVDLVNDYVSVRGKDGISVGGYYRNDFEYNPNPVVEIGNRFAAHVHTTLTEKVPLAFQRFGRSRGIIVAWVSDQDPNYGIYYSAGPDRIYSNYTRVFGEEGYFVSVHEYGHAFHWKAIDPPAGEECTDSDYDGQPEHYFNETETLGCGFREGFADFFAMWLAGDRLVSLPYGGDYGLENNFDQNRARTNPPPGGDGVRVEAAVAAFLYDLVDGPNEPDGPSNTANGDESFDGAMYPASWIADVIHDCRLGSYAMQMSGADQLGYCLESDVYGPRVEGQRFSSYWRSYSSINWVERPFSPPAGYSKAMVRRLWKYNMYGVLE